jgi:signal transduction histidine kinase
VIAFGSRWPLPVLALASVAAGVQIATGTTSVLVSVLLGVSGYTVAAGVPRRLSIRAVLAAAAIFGAALLYAEITKGPAPLAGGAVVGFLPLAAGWFIGDSVAARRRYMAGLAEQAERERAAEAERARQEVREERVRIARELHDVVAHTLTVITVQAGVGRRLMAKRPEEAGTALESIEMIGRTAQDELRVVLGLLRDEEAGAAALTPAPRLADLKELADTMRASGTPVELRTSGTDRQLSQALELTLYRVVQEALTNVVKHAPQARATVDLTVSAAQVRLEVTDDGRRAGQAAGDLTGDTAAGQERPGIPGHGIVGMRERIGAFGGWLVAEPLGGGFHVLAEVPIEDPR